MALYHFHADLIRRSKGRAVVAAAAYRAGDNTLHEREKEHGLVWQNVRPVER